MLGVVVVLVSGCYRRTFLRRYQVDIYVCTCVYVSYWKADVAKRKRENFTDSFQLVCHTCDSSLSLIMPIIFPYPCISPNLFLTGGDPANSRFRYRLKRYLMRYIFLKFLSSWKKTTISRFIASFSIKMYFDTFTTNC